MIMQNRNNNLALKYGFGDQTKIGPNANAYKTRMGALELPDPVSGHAVAGATTNNQKLGTSPDPRFNAATQAANNLQFNSGGQQSSGLPKQGFGSSSGWLPDGLSQGSSYSPSQEPRSRFGSEDYWDWVDQSGGVGARPEIHTIGSQFGADASVAAGWGQDYSVDVEEDKLPWYGRLPNTEGQPMSSPRQLEPDPNWSQRMMNTQYAQSMGKKRDEEMDAAGRKITGEGSYYSAGQPQKLYDDERRDYERGQEDMMSYGSTMGGADNLASYGDEYSDFSSKATADKTDYPSYDTGERFLNKDIIAANKDKYLGELDKNNQYDKRETMDDWFRDQDMPEINMKEIMAGKDPQVTDMERRFDAGRAPTDVEIDSMGGEYEKGIGATLGDAWGKFDKTFEGIGGGGTALAMGAKVVGDILQSGKNKGMQDDLRGMSADVKSAVGSVSNLKYAGQQAQEAIHGEERRMAGGEGNIALGNVLNKIKEISEGGLKSGSKSRLINKSINDSQTKTDIILADSYNEHLDKMSGIQEESVSERSILNEKLTEIDRQIAALDHDWMDTALDVGQIAVTGMNPAFGIAYAGARTLAS